MSDLHLCIDRLFSNTRVKVTDSKNWYSLRILYFPYRPSGYFFLIDNSVIDYTVIIKRNVRGNDYKKFFLGVHFEKYRI